MTAETGASFWFLTICIKKREKGERDTSRLASVKFRWIFPRESGSSLHFKYLGDLKH